MAFVTGTHAKSRFRARSARYRLAASRPGDRPFLANSPNATRITRAGVDAFGTVQLLFTNGVEFLNRQVATSSRPSAISHGQQSRQDIGKAAIEVKQMEEFSPSKQRIRCDSVFGM